MILLEKPPKLIHEWVEYPSADGEPMAETGFHVTLIAYVLSMLRAYFRKRSDVYVGGNMFMYYEEGDSNQKVAPDVFVALGVPAHERKSWFVWREGVPAVVFEFTSRSTRAADRGTKKGLYEWLGVQEYFLFDPLDDYLQPNLQGFRLVEQRYQAIPLVHEQLTSDVLGLHLQANGQHLDLYDRQTSARLLSPLDLMDAWEQERAAHQRTTVEVTQLREELARLRKQIQ